MYDLEISGDNNVSNAGCISGDCIANSTIINLKCKIMNKEISIVDSLDTQEVQRTIPDAIEIFARAELVRAESRKLRDEADRMRAEADMNNSIANLNYSKLVVEDREIMKRLLERLNIDL